MPVITASLTGIEKRGTDKEDPEFETGSRSE